MIRRLSLGLIVLCTWIGFLSALSFAQQRGRTLEDRVSALEQEVASLRQRFGERPERPFTGIGRSYRMMAVYRNGASILLGENIQWNIRPEDRARVLRWAINDTIEIENSRNSQFPYRLRNANREEQAEAAYAGRTGF